MTATKKYYYASRDSMLLEARPGSLPRHST